MPGVSGVELPPALDARSPVAWQRQPEQQQRLLDALAFYAEHQIPLRAAPIDTPALRPALEATLNLEDPGLVVLTHVATHERMELTVRRLLDANVVFASLVGFTRSWQVSPPHTWTDWDRALAWAEERADPHGGLFDPPETWRDTRQTDTPLFGWALDLVWGARRSEHGVPIVRLEHPATGTRRSLPLFDVARCYRRGQSPEERLRSRPIRLDEGFEQGWVRRADVLGRTVVVDRIDRFGADAEVVQLGFDQALKLNPDLEAVLETLQVHEITELQRRLEAHDASGGSWVLSGGTRLTSGRLRLPSTGWRLARDAFDSASLGEVRLRHPRVDMRLSVSFRDALDTMRTQVPVEERLFGDPCEGPDGPGFLRSVSPGGCLITDMPDDPMDTGLAMSHGAWVRANPDLVGALLSWMPDLGVVAEGSDLREALVDLVASERLPADLLPDVLSCPVPWTEAPRACQIAVELLERGERDLPVRWKDVQGRWWRWVGLDRGRFAFLQDRVAGALPALPGPDIDRDMIALTGPLPDTRRLLTAVQLTFAHPRLARDVHEWQEDSGLFDDQGLPVTAGDRIVANVAHASEALVQAIDRTRDHIALSATLGEDPRRTQGLERQRARLRANLDDVRSGKAAKAWFDGALEGRIGFGVAVGGVAPGARRTGDDRLRITEGIRTRRLGRLRCILVGGGDTWFDEATGPLITRLLDDIEGRIATAVHEAVDLDEVWLRARDAILDASRREAREVPYCSLVAALVHVDSGQTWLGWSGHSGAWRVATTLEPLTHPTTLGGMASLGRNSGLSEEDAVSFALLLAMRKVQRREIETVERDELVRTAERYMSPSRRSSIRAALGGAPEALAEEHERLLTLFGTFDEAYEHRLRFDSVQRGSGMLFTRVLKVRPGERIVLGTDGLTDLLHRHAAYTESALRRTDPQRAVEWLVDMVGQDEAADDLAVVVLDPYPSEPVRTTHTRRNGVVYALTEVQDNLVRGGVVPPLPDGSLPALSITPARLGRYYGEIDALIRRRKLPEPSADVVGFAEGVARWALAREGQRPPLRREGERMRPLHDVLEESDDDPLDETLITWWLLRRHKIAVRYVRGLRIETRGRKEEVLDTCWLHVPRPSGPHILDLGSVRPTLHPASEVRKTSRGDRWLLSGAGATLEYLPDARTFVEIAEPEHTADSDPWVRLNVLSRTPLAQHPVWSELPETDEDPDTEEVSAHTADGWLNLDV